MYAATQPFSHAINSATGGATGSTAAAANANPRSSGTTGSTSALATIPKTGTRPNWAQSSGAVTSEHAAEMARDRAEAAPASDSPRARAVSGPPSDEDGDDGRERELEPRVEQRVRVPGKQRDRGPSSSTCHASRSLPREPRNGDRRAGDRRADHGRLRPDGEHVRSDRCERGDDGPRARDDPEHARQIPSTPACKQHHVLAGDGQQVIQAGAAEGLVFTLSESPPSSPQQHALDERATLARRDRPSTIDGASSRSAIRGTAEAAPADRPAPRRRPGARRGHPAVGAMSARRSRPTARAAP